MVRYQWLGINGHISILTGLTGLEPATSAVTGRCSNQLNYSPMFFRAFLIMPIAPEFVNPFIAKIAAVEMGKLGGELGVIVRSLKYRTYAQPLSVEGNLALHCNNYSHVFKKSQRIR